jgi:protein-arginine kinase activator protein McsA
MAARPRHTGKLPAALTIETPAPMEGLREELRVAVEKEEYELAARLRDRLHEMEASAPGEGAAAEEAGETDV